MAGNLALCQGEVVDIRNASMNWLPAEVEVVNITAAYMYVDKASDDHITNGFFSSRV